MMLDQQLVFSDLQGPFSQGTNGSTNYYNRGVDSDVGKGEELWAVVQVATAPVGSGSTCNIRFVTDDEVTFTSPTVLNQTGALAISALPIGTLILFKLPTGCKQFFRVEYVVATADQSAGKFTAFLTRNIDDYKRYPRASYAQA